ncbi:MAG: NAD(P)/FAD-dependent oxidoreductase [Fimbriimonadaceae bacterium]
MQLSYWEHNTYFSNIDVAIIGSGIVGLSAALSLKTKSPNLNILVLERGILPYGASTRNAGFCCFGSITELLDDLNTSTEDQVFTLVERRYCGLKKLRQNLTDEAIDYENLGGYELINDTQILGNLPHFNKLLKPITGLDQTYIDASDKIAEFGFKNTKHLILNRAEGQIDTGKMMNSLTQKAVATGIKIINGITITHFTENQDHIALHTDQVPEIKVKNLLICTNGFAKQFLPSEDVEPARAQVLITKPIENLPIKGAFHYEKGYYYFRNVGNRVLFGGGRNLDFQAENTTEMAQTQVVQDKLKQLLREVILPNTPYEIEHRWSGIMGIGKTKSPIIKALSKRTFCAVRMGGMGVAIGTLVGEEVADLILQSL